MTAYNFGTATLEDAFRDVMKAAWMPAKPKTVADKKGWRAGDQIEVTLVGTVPIGGTDFMFVAYDRDNPTVSGSPLYLRDRMIKSATLVGRVWQAGDTIAVKYDAYGPEYTYVRGRKNWPGDGNPLSDERVNELFSRGNVRHLLRNAEPVAA